MIEFRLDTSHLFIAGFFYLAGALTMALGVLLGQHFSNE